MPHHWRPSDHLERSPRPGTWSLAARGVTLGSIEYGRVQGEQAFRALSPGAQVIGYSASLERACDTLWEWSVRTRRGAGMSAWPWPPIQTAENEWVVMRNHPSHPKGVVRYLPPTPEGPARFRVVTWAQRSEDRALIGYFPTLEAADDAVLEDSPAHIARGLERR